MAVFENGTKEDVLAIVSTSMKAASIDDYTVVIDPDPPENLEAFEPVTVTVTVPYESVSWLPGSNYMAGASLTGCVRDAGRGRRSQRSGQRSGAEREEEQEDKEEQEVSADR